MWGILKSDHYERRFKRYEKKKRPQLLAVLNNLDIFLRSLQSGRKPKPFVYGFLHSEPCDVIAVDQTGGKKVAATRLYVYPEVETETLYLLTLGDKATQSEDIEDCKRFVEQIKAGVPSNGGDEDGDDQGQEGEG